MKLPRERYVWLTVFLCLIVFVILAGSGMFESKWTKGNMSDSSATSIHELTIRISREFVDDRAFHVLVAIDNASPEPVPLSEWKNLRIENRKGDVFSPAGPQTLPTRIEPRQKYQADLTFPLEAARTFPLMLQFATSSLCKLGDHKDELRIVLQGDGIRNLREHPSRPTDSHQAHDASSGDR